ncbi:sulfotransferase [Rhodobacteraceae bacterium CCMM004]|nr:sulfotransferase [Rhodobacteraceae bacterium CCMM004]
MRSAPLHSTTPFVLTKDAIARAYKAALAHLAAGRDGAAEDALTRLRQLAPAQAEVPFQLGRLAAKQGRFAEAAEHLAAALALRPGTPEIAEALAAAQAKSGDSDAALRTLDALAKAQPRAAKPVADQALLHQRRGDFDAAEKLLLKALKLAPGDGELYRILMTTRTARPRDPIVKAMQAAWRDPRVAGQKRAHLGFALAKAMADIGATDRVFRYLDPANALVRERWPYDRARRAREVSEWINWARGAAVPMAPADPPRPGPILVMGMARSGTTLVEQILASHPDVTPGGEFDTVYRAGVALVRSQGQGGRLADVAPDAAARFADAYLGRLRARFPDAARVTDKSMQSYLLAGLIRVAIPGARLLVVERDPRAIALSIYRNVFAPGTHRYAYDLEDIHHYYAQFRRMIDFWHETAPGLIATVRYEDVVKRDRATTGALLDAAGLPWDDACLSHHAHVGEVETLSIAQVRQPLHENSVAQWAAYADALAPFTALLKQSESS